MRTPVLGLLALAAAAILAAATPASAELQVSMHDGLVTVNAKDVTIRQILAEWAKVGQTKIVNADAIVGGPMTLQFVDVPEEQALATLLRTVSGYLAAPRSTVVNNASRYDRIFVIPTAAPAARPTAGSTPPAFQQPRVQPAPQNDDSDNGPPPPAPPLSAPPPAPPLNQQSPQAQPQRAPVFNTFPPAINPQDGPNGPPAPGPTAAPSAAPGTSVPGMIIPAPGQPAPR